MAENTQYYAVGSIMGEGKNAKGEAEQKALFNHGDKVTGLDKDTMDALIESGSVRTKEEVDAIKDTQGVLVDGGVPAVQTKEVSK
jgi:hypothetical protein